MAKIADHYKFGFSKYGLIVFLLQELPYLFWLLFPPHNNPLLNNIPQNAILGSLEKIGGVLSICTLMLIINKSFSCTKFKGKLFFLCLSCLGIYYICWICYLFGVTNALMLVLGMTAIVPIYYLFAALWLKNYFAVAASVMFLIGHTGSNIINFLL